MCKTRLGLEVLSDIIDKDIMFYTFDDFMRIKVRAKARLERMGRRDFLTYFLYVYSRGWIDMYYKNLIWDYLNDYLTDCEIEEFYKVYLKKHGDKNE